MKYAGTEIQQLQRDLILGLIDVVPTNYMTQHYPSAR